MEENSKKLTDNQFNGFKEQVKESTNRLLHNFITMFLFLGVYERADEETKAKIENFLAVIQEDIRTVHIKKATVAFELTEDQKALLLKDMDTVLKGCLEPVSKLIAKHKAENAEKKDE